MPNILPEQRANYKKENERRSEIKTLYKIMVVFPER